MGTCITGSWSGGRRAARGFSLAEVIVAVGIMAGALVALLGLLGPSLRAVRDIADRTVAARLADRVARELQQHGFRNVEMETAAGPLLVVASAEGSRVVLAVQADNDPVAGVPPGLPVNERFFLVEVERAVQPAAIGGETVAPLISVRSKSGATVPSFSGSGCRGRMSHRGRRRHFPQSAGRGWSQRRW